MSSEENSAESNSEDSEQPTAEETVDELSVLKLELEDMKDKFARSMADLDNYKKRVQRDREQQILKSKGLAVSSFLDIIEIIDARPRNIEKKGCKLIIPKLPVCHLINQKASIPKGWRILKIVPDTIAINKGIAEIAVIFR